MTVPLLGRAVDAEFDADMAYLRALVDALFESAPAADLRALAERDAL